MSVKVCKFHGQRFQPAKMYMGVNPKMVGFPQQTHGFFVRSFWGVKWGVPPFKETPIYTLEVQVDFIF